MYKLAYTIKLIISTSLHLCMWLKGPLGRLDVYCDLQGGSRISC